jgi:hypothetical protein
MPRRARGQYETASADRAAADAPPRRDHRVFFRDKGDYLQISRVLESQGSLSLKEDDASPLQPMRSIFFFFSAWMTPGSALISVARISATCQRRGGAAPPDWLEYRESVVVPTLLGAALGVPCGCEL